jgi:hypothetical protein
MGDASGTARPIPLWRFVAARGHRPSINVRISPPEHLARLQRLTSHQVPFSRSCSRGRDGYRFTYFVFRCRINTTRWAGPSIALCPYDTLSQKLIGRGKWVRVFVRTPIWS